MYSATAIVQQVRQEMHALFQNHAMKLRFIPRMTSHFCGLVIFTFACTHSADLHRFRVEDLPTKTLTACTSVDGMDSLHQVVHYDSWKGGILFSLQYNDHGMAFLVDSELSLLAPKGDGPGTINQNILLIDNYLSERVLTYWNFFLKEAYLLDAANMSDIDQSTTIALVDQLHETQRLAAVDDKLVGYGGNNHKIVVFDYNSGDVITCDYDARQQAIVDHLASIGKHYQTICIPTKEGNLAVFHMYLDLIELYDKDLTLLKKIASDETLTYEYDRRNPRIFYTDAASDESGIYAIRHSQTIESLELADASYKSRIIRFSHSLVPMELYEFEGLLRSLTKTADGLFVESVLEESSFHLCTL